MKFREEVDRWESSTKHTEGEDPLEGYNTPEALLEHTKQALKDFPEICEVTIGKVGPSYCQKVGPSLLVFACDGSLLPECFQCVGPIHARHHQVQHHQVRRLFDKMEKEKIRKTIVAIMIPSSVSFNEIRMR